MLLEKMLLEPVSRSITPHPPVRFIRFKVKLLLEDWTQTTRAEAAVKVLLNTVILLAELRTRESATELTVFPWTVEPFPY